MSSIRLFILGSLDERGAMHGHQMRLLAEEEHIDQWTDFAVGAVYGAFKRLETEGLIAAVRTEREGNYPERVVYDITDAGRIALRSLRRDGLTDIVFRPDPVDLALARLDPAQLADLESVLRTRLDTIRIRLREHEAQHTRIRPYLTVAEHLAIGHATHRLRAEITWHEELLHNLPTLVEDELSRKDLA